MERIYIILCTVNCYLILLLQNILFTPFNSLEKIKENNICENNNYLCYQHIIFHLRYCLCAFNGI